MKRIIAVLFACYMTLMLCTTNTYAISKSKALTAARKHVPQSAVLKKSTKKGSFWAFEFRYKNTKEYDVLISPKASLVELEVEREDMEGGVSYKISSDTAKAKVKASLKATIVSCTKYRDDGCMYAVAFTGSNYVGCAYVNATNNSIVKYNKVYKRSGTGLISPAKARSIFNKKASGAKITSFDLDYNSKKKRFSYEIEGVKGKYEYELELNAKTGKVIDFDRDYND